MLRVIDAHDLVGAGAGAGGGVAIGISNLGVLAGVADGDAGASDGGSDEARRELPWLFGASACASGGAATALFLRPGEAGPARRLAIAGVVADPRALPGIEAVAGIGGR